MNESLRLALNEDVFPGNINAYNDLKSSISGKSVIGFIGSGASIPLFPSWMKVLRDLLSDATTRGMITSLSDIQEVEKTIDEDPLEAASTLEEAFTKPAFRSKLSDIFRPKGRCTEAHKAIVSLKLKGLVTLNYDDGLETASVEFLRKVPNTIRSQDKSDLTRWTQGTAFDEDNPPVLHWHGHPADPNNMIFTSEDYFEFYKNKSNVDFIESLWRSDRLLAIGFGFTDPFLVRIAENVLRLSSTDNRHFALVGYRGIDPISALKRRQFSKKFRLNPIFYKIRTDESSRTEDHSDLVKILNELRAIDVKQNLAPSTLSSTLSGGPGSSSQDSNSSSQPIKTSIKDFESFLFVAPNGKTLYAEPKLLKPNDPSVESVHPEYDEIDVGYLISSKRSIVVKSNPEFGTTTLCRRLLLDFHKIGIDASYRDCNDLPNYKKKLQQDFQLQQGHSHKEKILILDDFDPDRHERLLKEIIGLDAFARIIITLKTKGHSSHTSLTDGAYGIDFELIMLTHLARSDIRQLSVRLFETSDEDLVSSIVDKVYNDLLDLCIPLTPSNVIMYLTILYKEGDFQPLNRVQIVDRYMHELLRRPSDAYQDSFNAKNKIDVVSAFVHSLYVSKKGLCTEKDWHDFCAEYMNNTLIAFDHRVLFNELLSARVIIRYGDVILFKYRFFYSYFLGRHVANRSTLLRVFIKGDYHLSAEGLVQVITSISADNTEIVTDLTSKLENTLAELESKYHFGDFDPFRTLEWPSTDTEEDRLWKPLAEKLSSGPRDTKELDLLKTSIQSEIRTQDQQVTFREFDIVERRMSAYAFALIDAVTCSDALDGALKKRSLKAIFSFYNVVYQIGLIYAPVIAKHKFTVWYDTIFLNAMHFRDDEDEARRAFVTSLGIAESVARKANAEIGTKKLAEVFRVFADDLELEGFQQLLNFGLVLRSKPRTWLDSAEKILYRADRKSFYMRSMLQLAFDQFYDEVNTNAERDGLKRVIATIRAKRGLRKDEPGSKAISRVLSRLESSSYFDPPARD